MRALALTSPEDNPDVQAPLLAAEAEYLQNAGEVEAACEMAREACALSMRGTQYNTTMSCLREGVVVGLAHAGEYPFFDLLEELESRGMGREANAYSVTVPFVRGMLAVRSGSQERALDFAHKAFALCEPFIGQLDAIYLLGQLATLAAEAGDTELAKSWIERAEQAYQGEGWSTVLAENSWYQRARTALKTEA
jgi:hypothetical protein